jgi:hypothetical protein
VIIAPQLTCEIRTFPSKAGVWQDHEPKEVIEYGYPKWASRSFGDGAHVAKDEFGGPAWITVRDENGTSKAWGTSVGFVARFNIEAGRYLPTAKTRYFVNRNYFEIVIHFVFFILWGVSVRFELRRILSKRQSRVS